MDLICFYILIVHYKIGEGNQISCYNFYYLVTDHFIIKNVIL